MKGIIRKVLTLSLLAVFGMGACADLDVFNPNAPDAERALATAGDVESLIAGSYGSWWLPTHSFDGPSPILANASFQMASWPANFGMVFYSDIPRVAVQNSPTHQFYTEKVGYVWDQNYRALAAVAQGFRALDDPEVAAALGEGGVVRARAFGRFVQGLAHGSLALLYEEAVILDETVETLDDAGGPIGQPEVGYDQVMTAALGYFDEAIALASGADFTTPSGWLSVSVSAAELARIAHSMKARYRANVARNPEERAAVLWNEVIADVDAGATDGWSMEYQWFGSPFWSSMAAQFSNPSVGWSQMSYMIHGMADQSGMYQDWLSAPPRERLPQFADGSPRLIQTPDLRFPQGATEAEQRENPGMPHRLTGSPYLIIGPLSWGQPARGTFRWSYYRTAVTDYHRAGGEVVPEITPAEMQLLKAEGLLRTGDPGAAAEIVNVTRTDAGLSPADAAGTNDSCVPRLPDDSCGDLLEMLKWEKRLETKFFGVHANSWFFDGRGWGDLYIGTPLSVPVPCQEKEIQGEACESTGGIGGPSASPGSIYNFPFEG